MIWKEWIKGVFGYFKILFAYSNRFLYQKCCLLVAFLYLRTIYILIRYNAMNTFEFEALKAELARNILNSKDPEVIERVRRSYEEAME